MFPKNYKKLFSVLVFFLFLSLNLFFAQSTFAQGIVPCGNSNNPSDACTLCHLIVGISNLVTFGLELLVVVAAAGIFISGVMYMMAAGSEKTVTSAKSFLTASLTGFAVVLGAWFIISTVMWVLSVDSKLGIEKVRWDQSGGKIEFTCSTVSSSVSSGVASSGDITSMACSCFASTAGDKDGATVSVPDEDACRKECFKRSDLYYNLGSGQQLLPVGSLYCNCNNGSGFVGKSVSVLDVVSCDQECANRKTKYYELGSGLLAKQYPVTKTASSSPVLTAPTPIAKSIPCNCLDAGKNIVGTQVYAVSGDACQKECINRGAKYYKLYNGLLIEKTYSVTESSASAPAQTPTTNCNCLDANKNKVGNEIQTTAGGCDQECANRKAKYYNIGSFLMNSTYPVTKTAQ